MIKLMDVDYRLIHGQVLVGWVKGMKIDNLIVVDDEIMKNSFMLSMMKMGVPAGVKSQFVSFDDSKTIIEAEKDSSSSTMVLCKDVETARKLVDILPVKYVNFSNIKAKEGSKKYSICCFLTKEEENLIKEIIEKGFRVEAYSVPGDKEGISLNNIL